MSIRHFWDNAETLLRLRHCTDWKLVLSLLFANVKIFSKKIQPCVCNIPAFHQLTSFSFQLNFRNATLNFAHSRAAKMLDRVLLHFRQVRGRAPAASWPAARPRSWKCHWIFTRFLTGQCRIDLNFFSYKLSLTYCHVYTVRKIYSDQNTFFLNLGTMHT